MPQHPKGRGATANPDCRYNAQRYRDFDDGWGEFDAKAPALKTRVSIDNSRTILTRNNSPDLNFEQSINPYRGCEHGCIYCFARPTHAFLGLSPGLDFESRLIAKPDAAELLRKALNRKSYVCKTIAMGTNTDPYQPIEQKWKITRQVLEVLQEYRHPVSIVTKSSLIERDLDILAEMAENHLVEVMISVTTLNRGLARRLEPRAAAPQRRLKTIEKLSQAGIPIGVMVAPVIPVLTDPEIESILTACVSAGADAAHYVLLRLPLEVGELFDDWLKHHYPLQSKHVLNRIRDCRGGTTNDSEFGRRLRGTGQYVAMIDQRFRLAQKQLGLNKSKIVPRTTGFRRPREQFEQLDLF